jgi:CRP-like cAMP-binding protein
MKKALYILAELSDRDFEWLIHVGRSKKITTGSVLIHEGEPIDALYLVLEGELAVCVGALKDEEIARIGSGEVVGEISFVDARPPTATVRAVEESLVWSIPRTQLAAKLSQDVAFSSHFYKALAVFLSDRLRRTVSRLGYDPEHFKTADSDDTGDEQSDDLNPQLSANLELAKARLEWLLNQLKSGF